jgi:uncharacterized membrane protein
MATLGSASFDMYSRNLQRIFWADFIEAQTALSRSVGVVAASIAAIPECDDRLMPDAHRRHRRAVAA